MTYNGDKKTKTLTTPQSEFILFLQTSNVLNDDIFLIEPTIEHITDDNFKLYEQAHLKCKTFINETVGIEPHEIVKIIKTYRGNKYKTELLKLKNMIKGFNLYIIKKNYNTTNWKKQINNITTTLTKTISTKLKPLEIYNKCNDSILKLVLNDIDSFDITQYFLYVDNKYKLISIHLNPQHQSFIINSF